MLKNIFSKEKYNETHNIIKFLGLKIKYPTSFAKDFLKKQAFYKHFHNKLDITQIPPAEGQIRDIQLANLTLLKELDYVCKKNNLTYWLDFGTLLGAFRHRGFIPWDDDIDVGMPRNDYEKLFNIFNSETRNHEIFLDYYRCTNKPCQIILKVQHKKCPALFVDIFPYDCCEDSLSIREQLKKTQKIKKIRKNLQKKCPKSATNNEILKIIVQERTKYVQESEKSNVSLWGFDYNHQWKNWFINNNVIYPLKEIEFEKNRFPCINNIDEYLKSVYGDYLKYPKKIGFGHSAFLNFSEEEKKVIMELRNNEVIK